MIGRPAMKLSAKRRVITFLTFAANECGGIRIDNFLSGSYHKVVEIEPGLLAVTQSTKYPSWRQVMKPRGQLMIEHRLIEKMLDLTEKELIGIIRTKKVDSLFIDTVVDFIRVYADRTHHGKEEDILFRQLEKKELKTDDRKMMLELVEEHATARKAVAELVEANVRYSRGEMAAFETIIENLSS